MASAAARAQLVADGIWRPGDRLWTYLIRHPRDQVAVVCPRHGAVTYGELVDDAASLARAWHIAGIGPGDVVIVQLPNWYDTVLAHVTLERLGAVTLPVLMSFHGRELDAVAERSGAAMAVVAPSYRGAPSEARYESLKQAGWIRRWVRADETEGGLRDLGTARGDLPGAPPSEEITMLLATSGTTGVPKLVAHSSLSTVGIKLLVADALGLSSDDVLLMPSVLAHATGIQNGIRMPLLIGATVIFQERWDAGQAADLVERHGATFSMGATPFLFDLVDLPNDQRAWLRGLRTFACGGAPIPESLARRVSAALPDLRLVPVWGMSETDVATMVRPGDPAEKIVSSDGRPVPGWEVEVVDAHGAAVRPGEIGEMRCRGAGLFHGYFGQPELSAAVMRDGWLMTGDRASIDTDGYIRCLGRGDDFVIRGGMNIAPLEIEDLLRSHPGIADVAVVGVPDPRLGERVCAVIVPSAGEPTLDEIVAHLMDQGLAKTKLPERLWFERSLPITPSGKVQKHLLRELVARELAPPDAGEGVRAGNA